MTAIPDSKCTIFGVAVRYPASELAALDKREAHYDRLPLSQTQVEWPDGKNANWPDPFIFLSKPEYARAGDQDHPVYLSYIDTVIAGFLSVFGAKGATHFAETTADWHVPIINDRANPVYPRAVTPTATERRQVDAMLDRLEIVPRRHQLKP